MTKSALLAVALGTLMVTGTANAAAADPRVRSTDQRMNRIMVGDPISRNRAVTGQRSLPESRHFRFDLDRKWDRRMERNLRLDEIRYRHDSPPPPPPP